MGSFIGVVAGTIVAYVITIVSPATGMDAYWYIFLSGFIAICAMILPGISGSFILLLMGAYPLILGSISSFIEGIMDGSMQLLLENGKVIGIFAIGCILGLLSFARVVSYLFKRSPQRTLAVLTGFLIGSLNKIWPWKETIEFRINSHGESIPYLQNNLLPNDYLAAHGDSYLVQAVLAAIIGFGLVFTIEWLGARMNKS
jgi:putative membrane protein